MDLRNHLQPLRSFASRARRFRRNEDGNVMVYVTLTATVLLGMIGLALDGSRAMITHSEAQAAADAAALAAASQLDGQAGACARAKAEATAVANQQRFAQGGKANVTIAAGSPVCLNGLPASDSTSTSGFVTTSDPDSRYVQVTTQQLTHQNTLLGAVSSDNTALIQRTATAGFRRALCAPYPVMMTCDNIPWAPGVAFDAWFNGGANKGFICPGCNSANDVEATLAGVTAPFCVTDNADPAPGNKTSKAVDGVNTRLGIGSTTTRPSDLDIVDFIPFSSDLSGGTGWDCAAYWTAKHASDGFAKPAGCTTTTTTLTRYDVYKSERAAGKIPAPGPAGKTTPAERRLIYLAIMNNCPTTAPGTPAGYIKAFLLGPATGASTKRVYVEPIGLVTSKTDPTALHEEVQLYR
ncbi:pilus assembly protein TadG-related protein [Phenylobacterium sp. LjRoot225]|uniref:pilus assembly protein TadG-related protein n=1 Tax=Phenylobacterium sp. LjRoot225 TaxID=3342285 RepID=UPI003ECE856A